MAPVSPLSIHKMVKCQSANSFWVAEYFPYGYAIRLKTDKTENHSFKKIRLSLVLTGQLTFDKFTKNQTNSKRDEF